MKLTKEQVDGLISCAKAGINYTEKSQQDFKEQTNLVRKLVEIKVSVDRWNIVVTNWFFHSSKKEFIRKELGDKLTTGFNKDTMWGADFYYIDEMPEDMGLAVSMYNSGQLMEIREGKSLAVFPI